MDQKCAYNFLSVESLEDQVFLIEMFGVLLRQYTRESTLEGVDHFLRKLICLSV